MIKLKAEDQTNDLHLWKWLGSVLEHLGADGMSSDESSTETFETVYQVKNVRWRRDIANYMDIIDRQRLKDTDIFTPKGSKPVKRLRGTANPASRREPVCGLPRSFYKDDWFQKIDEYHQSKMQPTDEQFKWYNVVEA